MERWLPKGFRLENGEKVSKHLSSGSEWQLYLSDNQGYVLAISPQLYSNWEELSVLPFGLFFEEEAPFGKLWISFDKYNSPIASVKHGPYPENAEDARAFAVALRKSREAIPDASFEDAIYFERYSLMLPTYGDRSLDDQTVLCRWVTSGVEISIDRFDRLCEIVSWMSPLVLESVISDAGFSVSHDTALSITSERTQESSETKTVGPIERKASNGFDKSFSLPGRPDLEAFFNDHIIDIIRNSEKYKRMGIDFPSAIILHGPPGCGKTFAVEKLIEYLGWPSYYVDSGSIGSPFIHDTSKKISDMFDKAIENAPSVIVIDEMEAFLTAREVSQVSGQHHIEEVAEFLRRIPEATTKDVLVIAMTNLIDSIDPAILRRGRFDHIIEVRMPSKTEVEELLRHLFENLPVGESIDYDQISSRLEGHAMSDVTYVVKEAGRLAVKRDEDTISNILLNEAIDSLPKQQGKPRRIGF